MNWLQRIGRVFGFGRAAPDDPYRRLGYMPASLLPAGIHLSTDSALQIAAVWACVDAISKAISSSPVLVQTRDARGRRKTLIDDPLAYLLNVRPNPDMTAIGLREAIMFAALTWGNAYCEIVRDGAGRIAELQFLMPDRTTPRRLSREEGYRLVYEYVNPLGGDIVWLDPSDVFHIHGPGVNGLLGDNIVSRAALCMGVAAAQERFAGTYFGNNTVLGGWLEYPKVLNDESHARITKSWEDSHKGPDHAHKVAVLENGMKFHQLETTAEASQMIQARQFQIEEICRWFGVPPHKIQHLARSTFNNIEHLGIEWVRDGLAPWAKRFEQEAEYKLFAARSMTRSVKVDTTWLSHGDAASRAGFYKTMFEMGVFSINEIREKEGENDIGPEGDIRLVPLNMQTLEQVDIAEALSQKQLEAPTPTKPAPGLADEGEEPPVDAMLSGKGTPPKPIPGRAAA